MPAASRRRLSQCLKVELQTMELESYTERARGFVRAAQSSALTSISSPSTCSKSFSMTRKVWHPT
jgi:hypothetical protein